MKCTRFEFSEETNGRSFEHQILLFDDGGRIKGNTVAAIESLRHPHHTRITVSRLYSPYGGDMCLVWIMYEGDEGLRSTDKIVTNFARLVIDEEEKEDLESLEFMEPLDFATRFEFLNLRVHGMNLCSLGIAKVLGLEGTIHVFFHEHPLPMAVLETVAPGFMHVALTRSTVSLVIEPRTRDMVETGFMHHLHSLVRVAQSMFDSMFSEELEPRPRSKN